MYFYGLPFGKRIVGYKNGYGKARRTRLARACSGDFRIRRRAPFWPPAIPEERRGGLAAQGPAHPSATSALPLRSRSSYSRSAARGLNALSAQCDGSHHKFAVHIFDQCVVRRVAPGILLRTPSWTMRRIAEGVSDSFRIADITGQSLPVLRGLSGGSRIESRPAHAGLRADLPQTLSFFYRTLRSAWQPKSLAGNETLSSRKEESHWKRITPGAHDSSRDVNHRKIGR